MKFLVNGKQVQTDAPADMPLLWFLRDELGLTGSKFGCGKGFCGACTAHLDGQAIRSCLMPLAAVADRSITTIEGLMADGTHPLRQAWVEHNVSQCGFCQSGQVMNAASLLSTTPQPTDAEIATAMNGNLCRCGTYPRIVKAIHRAAQLMQEQRAGEGASAGEAP